MLPKLFINFRKFLEVTMVSVSTIIIVLELILNDIDYIIKNLNLYKCYITPS